MTVEELQEYGLARMDDEEVRNFLTNQGMGVLGLPAADAPYLLPLSFGYDGGSRLYFTFVLGEESRKGTLIDRTETARFLVYKADTPFNWESVLLTGTVSEVPEDEWDDLEEAMAIAWRPDLFEQASDSVDTRVYAFEIRDQTGIKHVGLPPGFERDLNESVGE